MKIATIAACLFLNIFSAYSEKMNVLCIVVDDLRDELSCYGFSHMHTPNIDQLAKNGTLFTRAYCQKALCGPSRSSFFTGMRPSSLKVFNNKDHFRKYNTQQLSLPQYFKQHGYHTSAFGKILHNTHHDETSWSQPPYYPTTHQYASKGLENTKAVIDQVPGNENHLLYEGPDVEDEAYRDGLITNKALEAFKQSDSSKPFFMMVGYHKPHTPFNAPKKYWDLYRRNDIKLATNNYHPKGTDSKIIPTSNYMKGFKDIPDNGFPDDLAKEIKHAYYACVSYIDAQVGKLINGLNQNNLSNNTLVVFWSDHGYQLGEHTAWCKHSNFEQALKVPFIIKHPKEQYSNSTNHITELIDIFPTLSEACNLPIPKHLDGKSLIPALKNNNNSSYALSEFRRAGLKGWSLRVDRYRYTEWRNKHGVTEVTELYDHKHDPEENINIFTNPENKTLIKSLQKQLNEVITPYL